MIIGTYGILIEQTSSNRAIDALPIPLTTGPYRSKNPECTEPDLGMEIGQ
jgi:hypothetical protein